MKTAYFEFADSIHVQMPPGTPTGFPVTQVFREEGSEFDTPFADSFMSDHHAALVQQFLDVPVAQRVTVVQPDSVLDDGHRESVAVGGQVGHGGSAYPNPVKATQPTELVPQNAMQVTEYHVPVMECPQCHHAVRGDHPDLKSDQVGATAHRLGPVLHATLQTLHHELGLPVRRIGRVINLLGGIQITQGAITQAAQRLAADGSPLAAHVDALQTHVQQAPFVHHDDTGWRIGTQNAWVGTFRSADTVVFRANLRHTNVEVREGLGQNFTGVLVSDRFSSYDSRFLQDVRQQKCLAHLIRNADEVAAGEQGRPGRGERYGQRVAQVFRDGIRLHRDVTKGVCTREEYAQQGEELTLRLDALLNRAPLKSKANERLRLGILKQHVLDRLWRFLTDPDIPPTNNAAERSLRTVVMARKVSQCSKNAVGAHTYMRIKSTVETARLRGQDPVAVLTGLMR